MNKNNYDEKFMNLALKEALKAYKIGEVPVGCVIVKDGIVIAKAFNKRESTNSPIGHAEILAINKAAKKLNSWKLVNCDLYVTLEPCLMCTGAILNSRIRRVVFATNEPKFGALGSLIDLSKLKTNHTILVTKDVLKDESSKLLKEFFREVRNNNLKDGI